jgi:hypothetical protein
MEVFRSLRHGERMVSLSSNVMPLLIVGQRKHWELAVVRVKSYTFQSVSAHCPAFAS